MITHAQSRHVQLIITACSPASDGTEGQRTTSLQNPDRTVYGFDNVPLAALDAVAKVCHQNLTAPGPRTAKPPFMVTAQWRLMVWASGEKLPSILNFAIK